MKNVLKACQATSAHRPKRKAKPPLRVSRPSTPSDSCTNTRSRHHKTTRFAKTASGKKNTEAGPGGNPSFQVIFFVLFPFFFCLSTSASLPFSSSYSLGPHARFASIPTPSSSESTCTQSVSRTSEERKAHVTILPSSLHENLKHLFRCF
ncbi:hypothetical protein IE53DRAFT_216273 [Violaceomyces palustris]|uniref:Uncharacterized protein n=1 Tax=Violaceomyces palustris TaxID=1673888 RepID=A0ACD0P872_9BASI|nr:hypothetical protein IE53DRAFT_216273 [Violaceomyces palustris]